MIPSNYPPGVTGNEPEITGEAPVIPAQREHKPKQSVFTGYTWCQTCGDLLIDPTDYLTPCA